VRLSEEKNAETREIRFDWLRALLDRAGKKETAASREENLSPLGRPLAAKRAASPTVDALLGLTRERLAEDWSQAGAEMKKPLPHPAERSTLETILARREFRDVGKTTWREQAIEAIINWLNQLLERLNGVGERLAWLGLLLRSLLWLGLAVGLVLGLMQLQRRSRLRLAPELTPAPDAPSARGWQIWLTDARRMAEEELWREAIHLLYWAAIARLEQIHLWPADRARTPREYLALLEADDARREPLTTLTRSFERTWYGGRAATGDDFAAALAWAAELGVE
jgi:hypothetical protein